MIRVFTENGDRTDRKKARLKYLIDKWGVEKFLAETEKLLAFPLIRVPASELRTAQAHRPRRPHRRPPADAAGPALHRRLRPRRPPARRRRCSPSPTSPRRFGTGELRLTVWQNLIIPNIPTAQARSRKAAILAAGLSFEAGTVLSGTVACTGNKGCRFAATDTKAHAVALANHARQPLQHRAARQPARHRLPPLLRPALHRRHRPDGRQRSAAKRATRSSSAAAPTRTRASPAN